jgi:hypothetical protein
MRKAVFGPPFLLLPVHFPFVMISLSFISLILAISLYFGCPFFYGNRHH